MEIKWFVTEVTTDFVNRNPAVAGAEGSRTPYKALLRETNG